MGISRAYLSFGASILLLVQAAGAQEDDRASPPPPTGKSVLSPNAEANARDGGDPSSFAPPSEGSQITRPEPLDIKSPADQSLPPPEVDVEVIVELTIDAEGHVSSANLVRGIEPYATAALSVAPSWTFRPASKRGVAVASKIHFLVTFPKEAPEPPSDPIPNGSGTPTEENAAVVAERVTPASLSGEVLEEVVVMGAVDDPAATKMTRLEVANLAGAFGDPLRAIESMPGVTTIVSGLPLFFVRGAPPGNVGYFIDGIRVPLLYHAFLGPSVLHPAMIRSISLSAGPMPTKYGRFAGATVEAELADVNDTRAEGSLRLIDVGAFAQSRFAEEKGYVQLSGRYSYTALLISAFSPGTRLDYWDYQARAGYAVGKKDELSVMALGAYDYVGSKGETVGGTEYHRVDLRWDHDFSPSDHLRTAVTWGQDRTRSTVGDIRDSLWGARLNFEHSMRSVQVRSGADLWLDTYGLDIDPSISEPENYLKLFPSRTDVSGGAFVDVVLMASSDVRVIPGVRFDHFSSLGHTKFSVDPRIAAEFDLTPRLRAIHSVGVAHQSPNFVPNVPGAQVGGVEKGLQRSLQASAKYEYELPWWDVQTSVTGFINGTQNLTDPIGLSQSFAIDETSADVRSFGRAYGLEFYLKRALTRRVGGLLSYTYSTSLRSRDRIATRSGFDRPHVLNAALTYDFGWNLRASVRVALASGLAGRRTTLDGFIFDESRSSPYVRLDAKVEKRFVVDEHLNWGIALEVLNATYTGNVTARTCGPEGCENLGTAPITFPLLGADIAWK